MFLEADICATKEFVKLPMDLEDLSLENVSYFGQGVVKVDNAPQMTSFGIVLNKKIETDCIDYYIAKAMNETWGSKNLNEKCICDFRGYSGGGLFLVTNESIILIGIAYYQDGTTLDQGYVWTISTNVSPTLNPMGSMAHQGFGGVGFTNQIATIRSFNTTGGAYTFNSLTVNASGQIILNSTITSGSFSYTCRLTPYGTRFLVQNV